MARTRRALARAAAMALVALAAGCDDDAPGPAADASFDAAASDAGTDAAATVDAGPDIPVVPDATMCALSAPTITTGMLRADGRLLRDEVGRAVLLRGVNAGGRSKWAPFMPFEFADDAELAARREQLMSSLAAWGVNVIRLPFSWEGLEPVEGTIDTVYLDRYKALIDAAWAHGMRVIVDFHQDVYASPFCGDGFPLWTLGDIAHGAPRHDCADGMWFGQYLDRGGPVPLAFERLWTNTDGLQDKFRAMWRRMATELSGRAGVIGFEIINEPGWGARPVADFEANVLPDVWSTLGAELRTIAPSALIVGGGPGIDAISATTSLVNPSVEQFVYAPHYYNVQVATGGAYTNRALTRTNVARLAAVGTTWNRPVIFGELGVADHSADKSIYLRDVYDALDATLSHATVWEVSYSSERWNDENLTIVNADGSERALIDEVVRPYARAVAGTVDRMLWLRDARTFVLEVSATTDGIAEIDLPTRHFGPRPHVGLEGGCASFDPSTGRLLVDATADHFTLVVVGGP